MNRNTIDLCGEGLCTNVATHRMRIKAWTMTKNVCAEHKERIERLVIDEGHQDMGVTFEELAAPS